MLQRGHSGDGCDLATTLCKYDLRKGDLFFLSWAIVQQLRRGSISSELLMFVFMSIVVIVWGSVGMFVVLQPLLKIVVFSLGELKYVVCLCKGCDGYCVFCLYCDTWSCRCSSMGNMSVFVMQMLYVCVLCASCGSSQCCVLHNMQFVCWSKMEEAYSRAGLMTAL